MTTGTVKLPHRALSGTELRNRSWGLISRANLDYAPKYIGITDEFNHLARAIDGLIRTPMGYYRLAEDTRDGTRVLLHSYERDQLTGIEQDGKILLAESATDIYGVTARSDVGGAIFRDDMNHDIRYLETCFQKDLNLHAQETVKLTANPMRPDRRAVMLANGHAAFGIYEMADGRWKVRVYANLRKSWDRTAQFVQADPQAEKGWLKRFFTLSRDLQEFDRYEDAFQYVRRFWKNESTLLFKGKTALADPSKFSGWERIRASLLTTALHFRESKAYRDWGRSIGLALGFGFVSTVLSGTPLLGAFLGLGTGAVWAVAEKSTEAAIVKYRSRKIEQSDQQQLDSLRPYFEQNKIGNYLRQDEANERRFRKKLRPDALPHLRLLNQAEADMNYDDGPIAPPVNILKDFERLSSAPYRYFGAQFDATHADKGVLACIFPNGLLSVIHVEKETRATRHYLMYSERFNAFDKDAAKKHLDPALTQLPADGPIHKITHRGGKDFRYVPMNGEEFIAALMAKVGPEAKDFRFFGFALTDLFNVGAAGNIEPKAKEALPVTSWLGQKPEGVRYG